MRFSSKAAANAAVDKDIKPRMNQSLFNKTGMKNSSLRNQHVRERVLVRLRNALIFVFISTMSQGLSFTKQAPIGLDQTGISSSVYPAPGLATELILLIVCISINSFLGGFLITTIIGNGVSKTCQKNLRNFFHIF